MEDLEACVYGRNTTQHNAWQHQSVSFVFNTETKILHFFYSNTPHRVKHRLRFKTQILDKFKKKVKKINDNNQKGSGNASI